MEKSNKKSTSESKPVELQRWEDEGGNPPARQDQVPKITGILRKLLINWHLTNSTSHR